jgi:predicted lipoprotein with Yx(FWY)xxD motif
MRRLLIAVAAAAAVALALTATGHAAGGGAVLKTRHGKLGRFLVDGKGHTLYLFQKDTTAKSRCSGACAAAWPPLLTTGSPNASGAVRKALLGTTKRSDGTTQVTYHGHPLYAFVQDKHAGDTKGQAVTAFGARWYAVSAASKKIGGYYGTLAGTAWDQMPMFQQALNEAETDPAVKNVMVFAHHPVDDPSGTGASQLGDRRAGRIARSTARGRPGR